MEMNKVSGYGFYELQEDELMEVDGGISTRVVDFCIGYVAGKVLDYAYKNRSSIKKSISTYLKQQAKPRRFTMSYGA